MKTYVRSARAMKKETKTKTQKRTHKRPPTVWITECFVLSCTRKILLSYWSNLFLFEIKEAIH